MKHPPMDLSRFAKCTIKKPAICDLLMVDEFKCAVNEFDGEITDEWVVKTVEEFAIKTATPKELAEQMLADGRAVELEKRKLSHAILQEKVRKIRGGKCYEHAV